MTHQARTLLKRFYDEYHGHNVQDLKHALEHLRGAENRPCLFLAGDSSLDNKYWFNDTAPAVNGYEHLLHPPLMKQDVSYWLNTEAKTSGGEWFALNCAVEESALIDRSRGRLLAQDEFVRDHISPQDTLVISVGGNDIALKPTAGTIASMLALTHLSTQAWIEYANTCCCNSWTCSTCVFRPPGLSYFVNMFKNDVRDLVERIVSKQKPKKIVICIIYFPLETSAQPCWADRALNALQYNSSPAKLQSIIRTVFCLATKEIRISGTEVMAFPLFETLDSKDPTDYVARVEPSAKGGQKMGKALARVMMATESTDATAS